MNVHEYRRLLRFRLEKNKIDYNKFDRLVRLLSAWEINEDRLLGRKYK